MNADQHGRVRVSTNRFVAGSIALGAILFIAISLVAASGTPDPTEAVNPSLFTSSVNSAIIVFREGLEAVLIFAAITASFLGDRRRYRRPVVIGAAAAFGAAVVTWFLMQGILHSFGAQYGDVLQVVTGGIAIAVLLLVMNWFFHKIYWTDHLAAKNRAKRDLVVASEAAEAEGRDMQFWGFVALGFTAVYREAFEVVLFLQSLQLKSGTTAVTWGVAIGLALTAAVGVVTFLFHHRLPYKKMLVLTGVLLGMVLVVMIGGTARTMQDLGWLSTTPLPVAFPDWWARWFELVPTWETVSIQAAAALFVVGSYYAAEWVASRKRAEKIARAAALEVAASEVRQPVLGASVPRVDRPAVPAQVRAAAYAEDPSLVPTAICGAEATTLCGAPALEPRAALEQVRASREAAPATAAEPAWRVTRAPAFTAHTLLLDDAQRSRMDRRAAPFGAPAE